MKKNLPDFSSRLDPAVCLGRSYASGDEISLLAALHTLNLTRTQVLAIEAGALKELASN